MKTKIIIVLLICALLAGAFFAYTYYRQEKEYNDAMTTAADKINNGDYTGALQIYVKYNENEDVAPKIDLCHYALAKESIGAELWDNAKIHLDSIRGSDYADIEELYAQCEEGLAKNNAADTSFLNDLEIIITNRMAYGDTILSSETVKSEMETLSTYQRRYFYDDNLSKAAIQVLSILEQQQEAGKQESRDMRQGYWYTAQARLIKVLKELYETNGFMQDNDQFKRDYIYNNDSIIAHADLLEPIGTDILTSMNNHGDWKENSNGLMYMTLYNSQNYRISIEFYFALFNMSGQYVKTVNYKVLDVPAKSEYMVYLDLGDFREKFRSDFDWEILAIQ